jgi:glycosyltransferase involved in cell wall biosynthesis
MSSTPPSAIKNQSSTEPVKPNRLPSPIRITEQVWPEGTAPVVSICCITYNHVNFIRDAIDGFLMQETTFPVEIIIRDDASTDGTAEIVKEYAEKYPQLIRTILHTENQYSKGKKAFPETRAMAMGEFIAICEGDDYWIAKIKLQKQVEILDDNQAFSLVFHNAEIVNTRFDRSYSYLIHDKPLKTIHKTEDLLKQWFIPTASILFRNYNDFVLPDWFYNCQSGDIPLLLLLSLKGDFFYKNEVMSIYRMHPDGISITHFGYAKAVGMIYIYQCFNIYTSRIFENKILEAIKYEIQTHWPPLHELESKIHELESKIQDIQTYYNQSILKRVFIRIKKQIKKTMRFFSEVLKYSFF